MFRSLFFVIAAFVAQLFTAPVPLQAQVPQIGSQVPGYYRIQLGRFEITALFDGTIQLDTKLLHNVEATDLNTLLTRMYVGTPKMQTAVNAYLVNTGEHLVLIDAGAGSLFGGNLGHILPNMAASGYTSEQVDLVLLTHMHGDHIGGLIDENDKPVFPKATIRAALAEGNYWLSREVAAAAPQERQHAFETAQAVAAAYQAKNKWQPFAEGTEIVTGIKAVKAIGHTPGHSGFAVESEGQQLMIWGDIIHAHAVQVLRPEVSIAFDVDQQQAVTTRKALLAQVAANGRLVAGMHLPFPGLGHLRAEGEGKYGWVPVEFAPTK
jgi:glyoxylase-like metal-dependent hydrolase (beta-lactamase superfamily II)